MNRLKLDQEVLGLCSIVERVTHARVIDGFNENEMYYFVVATGEIGKAIGERGINVQRFQQEFGKRVRMIEYNDNVAQFVKNVIYPLKVERIEVKEKEVILSDSNKKTKSLLIGRESKNLDMINRAVKRFFAVDVKVQ